MGSAIFGAVCKPMETVRCPTFCCWLWASAASPYSPSTASPANGSEEAAMIFDYAMGGGAAVLISIYLVYALLRPERF